MAWLSLHDSRLGSQDGLVPSQLPSSRTGVGDYARDLDSHVDAGYLATCTKRRAQGTEKENGRPRRPEHDRPLIGSGDGRQTTVHTVH
jgi:hypothetical protein